MLGTIIISLACLVLFVVTVLYINTENKYHKRSLKVNRLYAFAKKHNLNGEALNELYDISLDD